MRPLLKSVTALALLAAVAGCGGGSDGGSGPAPAPAPGPSGQTPAPAAASVSGVVIDGPIEGATVCLDLDGNGACDAGEPSSAPTGADGQFTVNLTEAQRASAAAWVASVPAGAKDSGVPVAAPFVLRSPAGKPAVISPVTTMIQAGITAGLAPAAAELAVASQFGLPADALYRNYLAEPGTTASPQMAAMAEAIVASLQRGEAVAIGALPAVGIQLRRLAWQDAANWYVQAYLSTPAQTPGGPGHYRDLRRQVLGGVEQDTASLYVEATPVRNLLEEGFGICGPETEHPSAGGSPSVGGFCGDRILRTSRAEDVSGQSIAAVINRIKADPGNTLGDLDPTPYGALTFPADSRLAHRTSRTIEYAVRYRPQDGSIATPIAGLAAAFPGPVTAPTGQNTVSLGSLPPATAGGPQRRPRVAFGADGTAYYVVCDLNGTASVNCVPTGSGRWQSSTINGVPVMTFTDLPSEREPSVTVNRVFVEVDGLTWFGYRPKADTRDIVTLRLDGAAVGAVLGPLGIELTP